MSAPMTKSQMAFQLPQLSYIHARWEEPELQRTAQPAPERGFSAWLADRMSAYRTWRENARARAELSMMSDRELLDVGLNRGDFDRIFDSRLNADLVARAR
jgi:uncharacterized protein YjiS (DUF1127 family)